MVMYIVGVCVHVYCFVSQHSQMVRALVSAYQVKVVGLIPGVAT